MPPDRRRARFDLAEERVGDGRGARLDPELLEEIRLAAEGTSPMFDNILRPTPIESRVTTLG